MVIDHTEITNTGISSTIHVGPISLMRVPLQSSSCDQIQWENGRAVAKCERVNHLRHTN